MPRTARVVIPGLPHHITQRGSRRFEIFRDEEDRQKYLRSLIESCQEFFLQIVAYCLMTNHVHFIAIPERLDSFQRVFHRIHGAHAQRFNRKYGHVGHLWQERPFSCVLDERHFWNAIRYVEQNPVRAGIVARASDYRWSSAPAHCRNEEDPVLTKGIMLEPPAASWKEWLEGSEIPGADKVIRDCTSTGRPCGDEAFVKRIEESTGRDFSRKKPGPKARTALAEPLPFD